MLCITLILHIYILASLEEKRLVMCMINELLNLVNSNIKSTQLNPWLIHVNLWQKPPQYCKVFSPQLIKINGKINFQKKKRKEIIFLNSNIC